MLVIVDFEDKKKTSQLVRWGTEEELQQFKAAVSPLAGKHGLLVKAKYRQGDLYR